MDIENEKIITNEHKRFVIVGIVLAFLIIVGGTFAYLIFDVNISNKNIASATTCFDIIYDADNSSPITGTLIPSSSPAGGLSGKITIGMDEDCDIDGYGNFYLNITTGSDILFQTITPHCENSQTLKTLVNYTNKSSCEENNGKWVTSGTALKYAIYTTNDITASTVPVKVDYIDSIGEKNIYENFSMTNVTVDYYVYVWLDGNLSDNSYANQSIVGDISASVSQVESGGVSGYTETILNGADPILETGMIPVTISNSGVATVADTSQEWYSYQDKQWANAVLVKENAAADVEGSYSREYYKNNPGTTVLESDILAYYVWIPRYKYKIWTVDASETTSPQTIDIAFENANAEVTSGTQVVDYITHPAFIWDGKTLSGIWVGKFETTGDGTTPTIKPNTLSLGSQNVSTQFITSLKFAGGTLSDGNVTFAGNNTYGLVSSTDSHMMKNSEWGAVAYLSHSEYGINSEIRINNNNGYTTGCGASEENGSSTSECQIAYGSGVTSYPQSTTGNITGVFDMSGGVFEYVMGVYSDSTGNPMSGNSSSFNSGFNGLTGDGTTYSSGISFPNSKYYDLYLSSQFSGNYSTNMALCTLETCGGQALNETAGWYGDYARFVDSKRPWFLRGGFYFVGSFAGAFDAYDGDGHAYSSNSWRSVLVVDGA